MTTHMPGNPAEPPVPPSASRGLVVDDDPIVAEHAATLLRRYGMADTIVATSVENARNTLAFRKPHLVLCDIRMPGQDGFHLLDVLGETCPSAGILVHSAHHERIMLATREAARSMGFPWVAHIAKPVSRQTLFDLIDDFFRSTRLRATSCHRKLRAEELQTGEFFACFQPQVYAQNTQQLYGIEALVRWRGPDDTILPPAAFLDLVESHDLEARMLMTILPQVLDVVARLRTRWPLLKVSVNIGPPLLADSVLLALIDKACADRGLPPSALTFELTEAPTSHSARWQAMLANAARMRIAGFGLSIDDFGTRESSLERAMLLPVNEIKIDKLFLHTARRFAHARGMLGRLRTIADELGAITVIEGIESEEDLAMAREMHFDIVQGFLIAWPLQADALLARYG